MLLDQLGEDGAVPVAERLLVPVVVEDRFDTEADPYGRAGLAGSRQ